MKKLLLILAILPGLAFAAKDTIKSDGKWSALTWSTGAPPGIDDTVYRTGNYNDTMDAAYTIKEFVSDTLTTGAHVRLGYLLTVTNPGVSYRDNGTGVRTYSGLTMTGVGATAYISATIGTITLSNHTLTFSGGGTYNNQKNGANLNKHVQPANTQVTWSGWRFSIINGGDPLLHMGDNSKLTINGLFGSTSFVPSLSDTVFIFGENDTVTGTGTLGITTTATTGNNTYKIGKLLYIGSGVFTINNTGSATSATIQMINNVSVRALTIINSAANTTLIFDPGEYNLTATAILVGGIATTAPTIFKGGSGTHTISSFGVANNFANSIDSLMSATFNCSGNWTFGSNHTVVPGTSTVNINGTGAQTVTSNGKSFYDLTINNSGTAFVALADSLTANDLTLTDGPFNAASYGISAADLIYTSQDSTRFQSLWLSGDFTRGALADKCDTAGQHIRFSAGASHTMAAAGKTYARVTTSGPLTITGGAIIATLATAVDGIPVTIATGTTLTAGTVSIGGTTEAPDTLQGAGAGATLDLTGNQTVTWADPVTVIGMSLAAGDTVTLTTGIDGGGNTGAWIFPSSTTTRRNRGWLGLGVWIRP